MKFTDADQATIDLFEKVRNGFSDVADAKFKLVFRDKRKGNDEHIVFAQICKSSDLVKHITMDIPEYSDEGLHYTIIIDKNIWDVLEEADRFRILRHELNHCRVIFRESGEVEYGLRDHEVQTFYSDIEIEGKQGGDPRWIERLSTVAVALYDEMKEKEKAAKAEQGGKRGRRKKGF
jgi:hypothetical protein